MINNNVAVQYMNLTNMRNWRTSPHKQNFDQYSLPLYVSSILWIMLVVLYNICYMKPRLEIAYNSPVKNPVRDVVHPGSRGRVEWGSNTALLHGEPGQFCNITLPKGEHNVNCMWENFTIQTKRTINMTAEICNWTCRYAFHITFYLGKFTWCFGNNLLFLYNVVLEGLKQNKHAQWTLFTLSKWPYFFFCFIFCYVFFIKVNLVIFCIPPPLVSLWYMQ